MSGPGSATPRTWRPMALWSVGIVCILGLIWLGAAVYSAVREVDAVLREVAVGRLDPEFSLKPAGIGASRYIPFIQLEPIEAVRQLGGPGAAFRKLMLWRRLSWIAPRADGAEVTASQSEMLTGMRTVLGHCGQLGESFLVGELRSPDPQTRSAAAEALKKIKGEEPKP